jgi:hypothetical protein
MQISDEGKIGIALALIGIGGGGALFVLPHPYADYVGWSLIGISVVGGIGLGFFHFGSKFAGSESKLRRIFFAGVTATVIGVWYVAGIPLWMLMLFAPKIDQPNAIVPPQPLQRRTDATVSRAEYRCVTIGKSPTDQKENEKNSAAFTAYMKAYGQAYNYAVTSKAVSGGDRADLVPFKTELPYPLSRSFQLLWIGKDLKGIYNATYSYGVNDQIALPSVSRLETDIRETFEGLAGVEGLADAQCEMQ